MALSTAVSAWLNVVLLAVRLKQRGLFVMDPRLRSRSLRILAATLLMAGALLVAARLSAVYFHE